jgi:hypothetical protein
MDDLKKGDYITNGNGRVRELVLARLEDLIFTCVVYPDGTRSPAMGPNMIEDAIKNGFVKEVK